MAAIFRAKDLTFQGAGRYDKETFVPLDEQGIVLIRGQEGAGKSMIAEVLSINVHGKGSQRLRKTRLTQTQIANEGGYFSKFRFESGSSGSGSIIRAVETLQSHKHPEHKSRFQLTVDGVVNDKDGKNAKKAEMRRLVPLSEGEWHGVVYLHQGGTVDLLAGGIGEKRGYITSVFGLDFYDDLVEVAKEKLSSLAKSAANIQVETLQQSLLDLEEREREHSRRLEKAGDVDELQDKSDKFYKKLTNLNKEIGELEKLRTQFQRYSRFKSDLENYDVEVDDIIDNISNNQEQIEALVNERAEKKAILDELARVKKSYEFAKRRTKNAKERTRKASDEVKSCEEAMACAPEIEEVLEAVALLKASRLKFKIAPPKNNKRPSGTWESHWEKRTHLLRTQKDILKMISTACEDATCPTCNQSIDVSALESSAEEMETQADKCKKKAKRVFLLDFYGVTDSSWTKSDNPTEVLAAYEEAAENISRLPSLKESLKEAQEVYEDLEEEFLEMPMPKDSEELEEELRVCKRKAKALREEVTELQEAAKLVEKIADLKDELKGADDPDARLEELEDSVSKAEVSYKKVSKEIADIKAMLEAQEEVKADLAKVNKKISKLGEQAALTKKYQDEILPYFTAMRTGKVRNCFSVLENVLPVYLRAMTSGTYDGCEAKFEIADDLSKVDLKLRSGNGAPLLTPAQSSGGQNRRFGLAVSAAMRETSPRHANFMFFDEPFTSLSGDGKDRFVNSLIPTLMGRNQDLTSVFIVAHDEEVLKSSKSAFRSIWTVETDGLSSTLKIGDPQ